MTTDLAISLTGAVLLFGAVVAALVAARNAERNQP